MDIVRSNGVGHTKREGRRLIRVIIAVYLISWLATMTLAVVVTDYEVSGRIADYSWKIFTMASVANIVLIWVSALGLFFFAGWARILFLVNILYSLVYSYVFGGGSGSPLTGIMAMAHTMLAGAILYAAYCDSDLLHLLKRNEESDVR